MSIKHCASDAAVDDDTKRNETAVKFTERFPARKNRNMIFNCLCCSKEETLSFGNNKRAF